MEHLRAWILGLAGAAVFCALCEELTPPGRVKGVEKLLAGLVMTLALLSPLLRLDMESYALGLAKYQSEARSLGASAEEISRELQRTFIAEQCRTYILDKAQALSAPLAGAKVTLRWSSEGYWYPVAVELEGAYHEALSELMEAELGIGRKEQRWSGNETA